MVTHLPPNEDNLKSVATMRKAYNFPQPQAQPEPQLKAQPEPHFKAQPEPQLKAQPQPQPQFLAMAESQPQAQEIETFYLLDLYPLFFSNTVTSLIGSVGNEIIIQCAADKTPQDGVYLYKQEGASQNKHEVFYYYKDGTLSSKSQWCRDNVRVTGMFPNFNVTILNLNATDTGFYWCEFNLEDEISAGTVTWLWIEESVDKNTNSTREADREDDEQVCSGDLLLLGKIFLIVCAVMMLLCITGFIFVILKGCWRNKKQRPSSPPSDSVYEEMKRSNLDGQPRVRTLINPDYQSIMLLH
ncbi:uncharacterized protein LOC113084795 [Carassius auratus]|uniref:Uncharacterized protein LOC113084795 n=1 Tax=Carassius auratus TaxID=7957 RepID=A0A6P6NNZ4_CARAU|nr:uncharacterized protein LOC113084795 [Carassius auratus]